MSSRWYSLTEVDDFTSIIRQANSAGSSVGSITSAKANAPPPRESSFKDGLALLEEFGAAGEGCRKPILVDVDQGAFAVWIEQRPCHITNLMPDLEAIFRLFGIFAQIRAMHFQPESLFTLAQGHQF